MNKQDKNIVYHKKANGTTYVYQVVDRYWDKEKQQARTKQVCIGKLDPETGALIPSKRLGSHGKAAVSEAITATTRVVGPSLVIEQVKQRTGIVKVLAQASPERGHEILALAEFLLCKGQALAHAGTWMNQAGRADAERFSSQRISELLGAFTVDEEQHFFKLWGKKMQSSKDHLCYDITSVSSYSAQNEYVRYGYNRDKEALPQVNLAVVYGQQSRLPLSFRLLPGSISDVVTVENLLDQFDKLQFPQLHLVMDRGFYSKKNVDELSDKRQHFTMGVPTHLKWVREIIDRHRDHIDSPETLRTVDDEQFYAYTVLHSWGEARRRCYLHFYYDPQKHADEIKALDQKLILWRDELVNHQEVAEHREYYDQFFHVKETPKRGRTVTMNRVAIQAARKPYAGFRLIISTKIKDSLEALSIYRDKDVIEKSFDDLKNELDMKRLRVQSAKRMQTRLFIQFIALILLSEMRKVMREHDLLGKYTAKSLLMELESLTKIHYSGTYKDKLSEATKAQRLILEAFGVDLSSS